MTSFNDYLPPEILVKIFSHYIESEGPLKFLRNVSPVSKLWNDLSTSYPLWKGVSFKSLKWNSDHLLKLGERGFLTSTRTLNLSCKASTNEESKMIRSSFYKLKIEDFFLLIDCCHNLKVLDVTDINFTTETTLQYIARKFPEYERFIVDSVTYKSDPKFTHSNMIPIDDGNKMIDRSHFALIWSERWSDLKSWNDSRIVSKIADCCPSLEELRFSGVRVDTIEKNHLFPIVKVQKGCPKLRVLEISFCNLGWSNDEELEGFKEIREFSASLCDFHDQDVGKIFRNSTKLESLSLDVSDGVKFSFITEIPTENLKCLRILTSREEKISDHLFENAVRKWRLTLRKLMIISGGRDLTNILKNLVQESRDGRNHLVQNHMIEEITVMGYLDVAFIKSLIRDCQKLRSFIIFGFWHGHFSHLHLESREALEAYSKS